MDMLIIWIVAIVLFAFFAIPFTRKKKNMENRTEEADLYALEYGLKEPTTLHPIVNPDECIGSGRCVEICPEHDVLGLRNGQAIAVSPANCIGHGLCERSCPVEAIQLVFGSERRGVDIPRIKANFETNVDGIYIIGELGGMGLIRNAFEQGRQCIEGILKEHRKAPEGVYDLVIIGCGPGGLSASIHSKHHGMRFVTFEREALGGTVSTYPRKKLVMTAPITIPGYKKLTHKEISKEELIDIWEDVVDKLSLDDDIKTGVIVNDVSRNNDRTFTVKTAHGSFKTMRVVLAIGRRGIPRKLKIPGEDLPNVTYSLREPDQFENDRITVVGGGDSAIEAALALSERPGNKVRISYRRNAFNRIKPGNRERVQAAEEAGQVEVLWSTNIVKNERDKVTIKHDDGSETSFPNDYLFIFAGGELPTPFLKQMGIEINTKFGEP